MIEAYGWRHPIIVSKQTGFIIVGHGRLEAALKRGETTVPVTYQDFKDETEEYGFMVADNAIADWADLDLSAINIEVPGLGPDFDIDLLGIKDFEIEAADKYADKDADAVPETRKTDIQLGDLFQLGAHRLLCGDATKAEDVERLMNGEKADMVYTDPPYGMNLDTDWSSISGTTKVGTIHARSAKKHSKVIGDDLEFDPYFIFDTFDSCSEIFLWGADYYCQRLPKNGGWLVWDKTGGNDSLMNAGFASNFELCWSKQKHKRDLARITWKGAMGRFAEPGGGTVHPTQKPVKLSEWFFDRWGKDKTNIVDLYGGSGSTLIACEKTGKRCFMSEIDPEYCQVIIDRWEKFTGNKAVKVS